MSSILLGEILLEQDYITDELLKKALKIQDVMKTYGEKIKLGEILIDEGWLSEGILLDALVIQKKKRDN